MKIVIGIDPGTKTGYAEWDADKKQFRKIESYTILKAIDEVKWLHDIGELSHVVWEDARLRTWFSTKGREALQGAGSIKRDCTIWTEFLTSESIPNRAIKPAAGATKWKSEQFKKITGWDGRTNEHSRDAAILVFNANRFTKATS